MCDPCAHRAILRAAKSLARSPAARCIDPDAAMPWLPMIADSQTYRSKDGEVPLHEIERRELDAFTRRMREMFGGYVNSTIEDAKGRGLTGRAQITYVSQRMAALAPQLALEIATIAGPYGQFMATAGVQAGISQIEQASRVAVDYNVIFDEASEYAVEAAQRAAQRVGNTASRSLIERVQGTIADGIEQMKDTDEVTADLMELGFDEVSANRIARTESVRAYTDGQIAAWEESGVVTGKQWLLSPTSCEFCEIAAQEYGEKGIALDQPFFQKGDRIVATDGRELNLNYEDVSGPPLHPFCRCTLVPVMDI